jgi:hypothetical protein
MAQKKKKEPQKKKEEEFEWTPPNFNEREFLEKDIRGTKTLLVTALISLICGILAFLLGEIAWLLGMVIIIAGIISLKYLYPLFKLDPKEIEKKSWAGNIAIFFFLSLGIWILLMNPPFSDHISPEITSVEVYVQDSEGGWQLLTTENSDSLISSGEYVNITADIADNGKLSEVLISVHLLNENSDYSAMTETDDGVYTYVSNYTASGSNTNYYYTVKAIDSSGNEHISQQYSFLVNL